jgi:hypothetical protein
MGKDHLYYDEEGKADISWGLGVKLRFGSYDMFLFALAIFHLLYYLSNYCFKHSSCSQEYCIHVFIY